MSVETLPFVARRPSPRTATRVWADAFSIEASFLLFLFAGRYKALPELRGFPVDFTLFFFATTCALMAWAIVSGRLKLPPLSLPVLFMMAFCSLATVSIFWSSIDGRNIDKLLRFLLLTSTSFFAADILGQETERRERLMRLLVWFSVIVLLYYAYYRYVLGIDMASKGGRTSEGGNNYLEYNAHAGILFIVFLAVAVCGSSRQLVMAVAGSGAALFALVTVGGRGPLALALLAIPLTGVGLLLRVRHRMSGIIRMLIFVSAVIGTAAIGFLALLQLEGTNEAWSEMRTLDRYQMQLSREHTDSMDVRIEGQAFAFRQWQERPLLGWGIGEFRVQNNFLEYPHNLLFEILMEMGLVGAYLFFSICAIAVIGCVRVAKRGNIGWADTAIILLFVTELISHLTVQGYLADDRYFLAYLALAIGLQRNVALRRPATVPSGTTSCGRY